MAWPVPFWSFLCALAFDAGNKPARLLHCGWLVRSRVEWRSRCPSGCLGAMFHSRGAGSYLYEAWARHPLAAMAFSGAFAAAVGIMFVTAWVVARPHYQKAAWLKFAVLIGSAFVLASYFSVPPFRVLLLAAAVGSLWPATPSK